jgi:hypothetical protein
MLTNTLFVKNDWVSLGKKWGDLPPRIKRAAKQDFLIPRAIRAKVLPSPGISVQDVLAFTLPNQVIAVSNISPAGYFSRNVPDAASEASVARLRRLPVPHTFVVKKLVDLQHQAWLDGFQSVRYVHLSDAVTTHFPLWLVSFWDAVVDLRKNVYAPWSTAREWLNAEIRQNRSVERHELAGDAKVLLAALPWDSEVVKDMWRYLGTQWTTSSQQNNMLDDLSDRIAAQPHLAATMTVKNLAFSAKILEAAAGKHTGTYQSAKTFAWLRTIGDNIAVGKQQILTQHHLGKDNRHWVGLVVDGEHETIHYGDSFGSNMPSDVREAYQWWLAQHSKSTFALRTLAIAVQDDNSSCGFLATNSLEHFAFPDTVPLLPCSEIQIKRLRTFILVAQQMLDQVHCKTRL